MIFSEKRGPFLINGVTVGLYGITNFHTRFGILLLQYHHLTVKIQACKRWLTALEHKGADMLGIFHARLYHLFD